MINWIRKLFSPGPSSPTQPIHRLDDRLLAIIDEVDAQLASRSSGYEGSVKPQLVKLPLCLHSVPWEQLARKVMAETPATFNYLPRSIAAVVDNDGTWNLLIGFRSKRGANEAEQVLFADALHRTNDARQ